MMIFTLLYISFALIFGITITRMECFGYIYASDSIGVTRKELIGCVLFYAIMMPIVAVCLILDFYYMIKDCYKAQEYAKKNRIVAL